MKTLTFLSFLLLTGCCTITSSIVDTHGEASDVVDEAPTNEVTASPTITATVPVSAIPK